VCGATLPTALFFVTKAVYPAILLNNASVIMSLRRWFLLLFMLLALAVVAIYWWLKPSHPDALWRIVSQQCLPNQQQRHHPAPCTQVDRAAGFVVLKDRNGPLQYLLMPTAKITGIESPQLLATTTPNFFQQAWQARRFMAQKYAKPIDDADISLAINSEYGRTQNQLHIHISCLSPAIKSRLTQLAPGVGQRWQSLPGGLLNHDYLARRVTPEQLAQQGAFRLLASGVADAEQHMGRFGLAMTALPDGDFLLLATERNLLRLNLASAEEIQDHHCRLLSPAP
jgi:CDP-diacylglycerol pyrophosphatase